MNPMTMIGLLLDGAQVLFENIKIISILSANIIGIGIWVLWGIFANRVNREWSQNGVALLSIGMSGFVLLSDAIVVISRIWHLALPILSEAMLLLSLLAIVTRLLLFLKKNFFV